MQPVPRTITLSMVEALTLLRLRELKNEATAVVVSGSLLVTAGWLFFG